MSARLVFCFEPPAAHHSRCRHACIRQIGIGRVPNRQSVSHQNHWSDGNSHQQRQQAAEPGFLRHFVALRPLLNNARALVNSDLEFWAIWMRAAIDIERSCTLTMAIRTWLFCGQRVVPRCNTSRAQLTARYCANFDLVSILQACKIKIEALRCFSPRLVAQFRLHCAYKMSGCGRLASNALARHRMRSKFSPNGMSTNGSNAYDPLHTSDCLAKTPPGLDRCTGRTGHAGRAV